MIINEDVRRGVELLDLRMPPEWFRLINVPDLDQGSPFDCVLGQLFAGDYAEGLDVLCINAPAVYGFNAWGDEPDEYRALTRQWAHVITERLTAR